MVILRESFGSPFSTCYGYGMVWVKIKDQQRFNGSNGFAVTSVAIDVLDAAAASMQYTLQGYGTLSHLTAVRLDLPRGLCFVSLKWGAQF